TSSFEKNAVRCDAVTSTVLVNITRPVARLVTDSVPTRWPSYQSHSQRRSSVIDSSDQLISARWVTPPRSDPSSGTTSNVFHATRQAVYAVTAATSASPLGPITPTITGPPLRPTICGASSAGARLAI